MLVHMVRKMFLAVNVIVTMVAAIDFIKWGVGLADSSFLWVHGTFAGCFLLALLTLAVICYCMLPSYFVLKR